MSYLPPPSAGVKPTADATAQASQILTDYKDKKVGLSYEISERARSGTDKVWSQAYGHVSKGDDYGCPVWNDIDSSSPERLSPQVSYVHIGVLLECRRDRRHQFWSYQGLWSDVDNMVYSGTIGNDLSSRPVALQVYGDQSLSDFDASLTGSTRKLKASGNDAREAERGAERSWIREDEGGGGRCWMLGMTQMERTQVRIGTDGKMKAGAGAVVLDEYGMTLELIHI